MSEWHADAAPVRRVVHRTRGYALEPITRLVSPGDFRQVIKPFVSLGYFDIDPRRTADIGFHPHSAIATITAILEGQLSYEEPSGTKALEAGEAGIRRIGNRLRPEGGLQKAIEL